MASPAEVVETVSPSPEQGKAIDDIVKWYRDKESPQEFYLAGYAGVGKSTIAAFAVEEIKAQKNIKQVRTAAYTGKAASVLRRKGIDNAQTIHSLIYKPRVNQKTGEVRFVLAPDSDAADADLIVLDECSMASDYIARDLRSFGKKILVMGDPAQLPPLNGQGAFTNREPDAFLREIHRQAADSPILELATLARQGKPLPANYSKGDVRVLPLDKESQSLIYREETQPICGLNRVRWTYNLRIRARRGFSGQTPQKGERIICCRNDKVHGIFNGGLGTMKWIKVNDGEEPRMFSLDVEMDDLAENKTLRKLTVDPYLFDNHFNGGSSQKYKPEKGKPWPNEFDFAYVLTAHKAQGSGWPDVTVIDDSAAFRDNRDAWLYTAMTRAETALTFLTR